MALLGLALVAWRTSWRVLRNVVTIAHEGGHALVAVLSGRSLQGIRLHSDTSGLTVSSGRTSGPGMVLTLFSGYPAVSVLGIGAAWLVDQRRSQLLLWIMLALLAAMLLALRNVYGVVSVVATGVAVFAVSWLAASPVQAACCEVVSWFLLFGGIRPIGELAGKRRRGRAPDSDADQLARLTGVPALLWLVSWLAIGLAAVGISVNWLLLHQ